MKILHVGLCVEFKEIPNYPKCQIGNDGSIISLHKKERKILNPVKTKAGYYRIGLYNTKGCKIFFVHRLVAENFVNNEYSKDHVNHIDGNKLNNNHTNLEWCTSYENMAHAVKTGLLSNFGQTGLMNKLNQLQVSIIKRSHEDYGTLKLARIFSVSENCIRRIIKGTRQKRHYFGKWKNQEYFM